MTEGEDNSGKQIPSIDEATDQLSAFFELNPYSTIDEMKDGSGLEICKPWGDPSLSLVVEDDFSSLAAALNAVKLPERFSAIWHSETRELEVIWTAFKLPKAQAILQDRAFKFSHRGKHHDCWFGKSSEQLLSISRHARPLTISNTNHRNIQSFTYIFRGLAGDKGPCDEPRSFWVSNIDWDEDEVVDIVTHLNFHMTYFDGETPTVLIHPAASEPVTPKKTRFLRGDFPTEIDCAALDENMLSFWSFAQAGNPMLRFLLYYRILEYAAYHFVIDEVRDQLRKILIAPDLKSDINRSIGAMMGAMGASKLSDSQRLRALARKMIDPALLWRDLQANSDFFTKDTNFDGGFSVRSPIGKNDKEDNFGLAGVERVVDRFREIRNALSHGKDQESSGVIRPTPENSNLFRPWVHLIATAAGEIVLYGTNA